jgi:hypothetical protein
MEVGDIPVSLSRQLFPSKLSHTLTLTSYEENPKGSIKAKQFFLDNTAALYRGWDVYLNGGLGTTTDEGGVTSDSRILNAGTQIVPHPSLTLNLDYFFNETKSADDSQADGKIYSRTVKSMSPISCKILFFSFP